MADRYSSLSVNGKTLTNDADINEALVRNGLWWVCDAEIEGAVMEIRDKILVWNDGTWYWGEWRFGQFNGGRFLGGTWQGGVFKSKNAEFKGQWVRGIRQ